MGTFTASISNWQRKTEDQMERVAKQSMQEVISIAQVPVAQGGNMPVDTGFLRNSLVSSLEGAQVAEGADSATLAIAQFKMGNTVRFAWTASYAIPRHYMVGAGQGGGLWRDLAAAQWPAIVARNSALVR